MTSFCGCDPGLNGGWVVVSGDKVRCRLAMPIISFTTKEGKTKTEIDRHGVLTFLSMLPSHTNVTIEEAQGYRNQSLASTCTTFKNYGLLLMALTVAHMYITEVPPDIWQTHFGIVPANKSGGKTTKEQAFDIAHMLYPNENFRKSERAQKPHDGIVDATLIAEYCQSRFAPFLEPPTGVQLISTKDETPRVMKTITGIDGIIKPLKVEPGGKQPGTTLKREMF